MTTVFNGMRWADQELEILRDEVTALKRDYNLTPHLVTILVGDNPSSKLYSQLKLKAANKIGAKFTIKIFEESADLSEITEFINSQNNDENVHGIMLQLPLPENHSKNKAEIINNINPQKDVDGLRKDSNFVHPTAQAIYQIMAEALFIDELKNIAVIGAKGMVGSSLANLLNEQKIKFHAYDIKDNITDLTKYDLIITTTGKPNLIKPNMIRSNVNLIDVGYPKADVSKDAIKKAKFITPVPGGVGPVTISLLLKNLVKAAQQA